MKSHYRQLVLSLLIVLSTTAFGQSFDGLHRVDYEHLTLYYSEGHEPRAKDLAVRTQKAIDYNHKLLGFKPEVIILVLSPEDWSSHTTMPVYGMPHYRDDKTLIVASSDNNFWKSFIPPVELLPTPLAEQIRTTYSLADGSLSMQPFFDLLVLHELGHAFHKQGGLTMQRKWMGELFCNILLHTYIAENEPEWLPALTVFPNMVVNTGSKGFLFTTLQQLEENYSLIGKQHPRNYGWYQSRWHAAAAVIYETAGKEVLLRLWKALENQKMLTDREFADLLNQEVHPSVGDVLLKW